MDHDAAFVRLEKLINGLHEQRKVDAVEFERRVALMQSSVSLVANDLIALRKQQEDLRERVSKTHDTALGAMRAAEGSVHDLESTSAGIVSHLARIEAARDDADKRQGRVIEDMRALIDQREHEHRAATALHTERFRALGDAINALARNATGDRRLRLWSFVIIPALVVMLGEVMDFAKLAVAAKYGYHENQRIERAPP